LERKSITIAVGIFYETLEKF